MQLCNFQSVVIGFSSTFHTFIFAFFANYALKVSFRVATDSIGYFPNREREGDNSKGVTTRNNQRNFAVLIFLPFDPMVSLTWKISPHRKQEISKSVAFWGEKRGFHHNQVTPFFLPPTRELTPWVSEYHEKEKQ